MSGVVEAVEAGERTALVVDDDEAMRTLLKVAIEAGEAARIVGEADDGLTAITAARRTQPDVVVLDAMMPNMGGIEAIPAIRAVSPQSRIIVFSAALDEEAADRARRAGAHEFLSKTDPIGDLVAVVRAAPVRERAATAAPAEVDVTTDDPAAERTGTAVDVEVEARRPRLRLPRR